MKALFLAIFFLNVQAFAASNVAKVIVFKGKVYAVSKDNKKTLIKQGEWLREGTKVQTSPKSFVRLKFIDKSQMNVGPESEVKIEKFSKDKAGVISVLKGKLRSKVSKDYLQMEEGKSKLFVKSKNAVMGIRGTDFSFMVGENQAVTAVLYEGSVYFNKLDGNVSDLESIVNRGVAIRPGEFSVVNQAMPKPTLPAKMNIKQFNNLKKNDDFKRGPDNDNKQTSNKKAPGVPPGLNAAKVANTHKEIDKEVGAVTKIQPKQEVKVDVNSAKGFVRGSDIKPTAGSAVDINSGVIIPPAPDANFDANLQVFVDNTAVATDGGVINEVKVTEPLANPIAPPPVGTEPNIVGDKPLVNPDGSVPPPPGTDDPNQPENGVTQFQDPGNCTSASTCGGTVPPSDPAATGNTGPAAGTAGRVIIDTTNGNP